MLSSNHVNFFYFIEPTKSTQFKWSFLKLEKQFFEVKHTHVLSIIGYFECKDLKIYIVPMIKN